MSADGSKKKYLLEDYVLYHAKSEEEILAWAKADSSSARMVSALDTARTERVKIDDKDLLILLATRPMATTRVELFVYVGGDRGWGVALVALYKYG